MDVALGHPSISFIVRYLSMKKRIISLLLAALMLAGLMSVPALADEEPLKVALVVADAFGDRSFYDSSKEGLDNLAADAGIEPITIECNGENHAPQIRNAADVADVVICVGWEFYDVETIAPEYPDVKFIWVDNPPTGDPVENVLYITYAQNEGSFLAGYIAAYMTETGIVGAVGGEDSDTINDFIVGYEQGAQYFAEKYETTIEVVHNYSNTYEDPAVGKECALALIDQGADVIFQIASAAGDGVFEAAEERGVYAIGVDADQKHINEDVIICSMMKEEGDSIYTAVSELLDGDDSRWGTVWVADMSTGYVGIGYGEEGSKQQITDDIKAEVDEVAEAIISGEIVVNTTR